MSVPRRRYVGSPRGQWKTPLESPPPQKRPGIAIVSSLSTSKPAVYSQRVHSSLKKGTSSSPLKLKKDASLSSETSLQHQTTLEATKEEQEREESSSLPVTPSSPPPPPLSPPSPLSPPPLPLSSSSPLPPVSAPISRSSLSSLHKQLTSLSADQFVQTHTHTSVPQSPVSESHTPDVHTLETPHSHSEPHTSFSDPHTRTPDLHSRSEPSTLSKTETEMTQTETHTQETHTVVSPPMTSISFTADNEDIVTDSHSSVHEYLAFSDEPLTLQTLLQIQSLSPSNKPHPKTPPTSSQGRKRSSKSRKIDQSPKFQPLPSSIHHFCVDQSLPQLPLQLQILSRKSHSLPLSSFNLSSSPVGGGEREEGKEGEGERHEEEGRGGGEGEAKLEVCGLVLQPDTDRSKLIWTPAPPKLSLHPLTIKQNLFPYHPHPLEEEKEEEEEEQEEPEEEEDDTITIPQTKDSTNAPSEVSVESVGSREGGSVGGASDGRGSSGRSRQIEKIATFDNYEQYQLIMSEITWQRDQLINYHTRKAEEAEMKKRQKIEQEELLSVTESMVSSGSSGVFVSTSMIKRALRGAGQRRGGMTVSSKTHPIKRTKSALFRAHFARTELSKPTRPLYRSASQYMIPSERRLTFIEKKSNNNNDNDNYSSPVSLTHSTSSSNINKLEEWYHSREWAEGLWDKWFYEVLSEVRSALAEYEKGRRPVQWWLPDSTMNNKRKNKNKDTDSPSGTAPITLGGGGGGGGGGASSTVPASGATSVNISVANLELTSIQSLPSIVDEGMSEVDRLTNQIMVCRSHDSKKETADCLTQRGGLYRKLGLLEEAMKDFNEALEVCPFVATPHWERHLIYLVQGKEKLAVDELTQLLKKDANHAMGFISKGILLAKRGDLSSAIDNLTRAIWKDDKDPHLIFLRGELREKRGETEAAMSDYATVVKLQPNNEEALIRQAKHRFNKRLWGATTQTLTSLLNVNRSHMEAWLLRSLANLEMEKKELALRDLSAAIHFNPQNSSLFFKRGCLLRHADPGRSLMDFSVSILLDSSKNNSLSYLHRGVMYTKLRCYEEALSDFLTAAQLSPCLASAHTNAGLILLNHMNNPISALKHFTTGLQADPTYVRALMCKAEAHTELNQYRDAVSDWSKAIHIYPNNPSFHLRQGKVYLLLKDYENAINCIRVASKLDTGVGGSHAQKALVYSFLGDHEKAVSMLRGNLRGSQITYLHTVLGKVYLRGGKLKEAAESFKEAQKYLSYQYYTLSDAECDARRCELHYLCGQSLIKCGQYKKAAEEFGYVIALKPKNAMAHYYRGVALLKQGSSRGMFSISHALMLQPDLVKGYLTRAAYYGMNNRISKAIMNCTEAINIEPKSIRAYLYRGVLRHQIGYNEVAIKDLTAALELSHAHCTLILFNRAICYEALNKKSEALNDYSVILLLEDNPSHEVFINRGLLYLSLGDHFNALMDFLNARKSLSQDPSLCQAIAYCHHKLGDLDSAIRHYTEAISLDSSFVEAYIGRGNVHVEYLTARGNKRAKLDFMKVVHQYPNCLAARVNLALLLHCEGKFMTAWRQLTNVLSINKFYTPALEARSIISLQMSNTFGALLDMSQAVTIDPTPLYYTERGTIHYYTGDSLNAVRDFEKALQLDPSFSLALYNLGNILLQQRLYSQACERFSRVLALHPCEDESLINRGLCYVAMGKNELALEDFNNAISINPFAAHAYLNRGNIYKVKELYELAEKDYQKAVELQPGDALSLQYHGEVLSMLGRKAEARQQFVEAQISLAS